MEAGSLRDLKTAQIKLGNDLRLLKYASQKGLCNVLGIREG